MIYPRRIIIDVKKHLKKPEVTVITGMRRTGKSTILKYLYESTISPNRIFLDLENRINRELFKEDDYELLWSNLQSKYKIISKKQTLIFLDEIQYSKNIPSIIKYLYDHYKIKFIVTGSSSYYLKNLFSESLSGRKQIFELFPLTFDEFLVFKGKIKNLNIDNLDFTKIKKNDWMQKNYDTLYEEYLKYGGFPQVVLEKNIENKLIILKDILYSYIEIDVKNLSNFRGLAELEKLIKVLAVRVGQKLDVSKISREISIARQTVMEYLSFLGKTYFIYLVKPYSQSVDRQLSKALKIYLCDTGIINLLASISSGQILENSIFLTINSKYKFKKAYGEINYYQRKSGAEIDFIVDNEVALEIKETSHQSDLRKLKEFIQRLKINKYFLVSKNISTSKNVIYASQL